MNPRTRVGLLVAAVALAAAGATVALTLATSDGRDSAPAPQALRTGAPPLVFDLGLRRDREALALRQAELLYDRGQRREAGRIFARHRSLESRVGSVLAGWPDGALGRLERLSARNPRSGLVRLHLGLALYWHRRADAARRAWRAAKQVEPDSLYALRAEDFLHPDFAPGRPFFYPSFALPERVRTPEALATLGRAAAGGNARLKLAYGSILQRMNRPVAARRQFAAAAALARGDAEAQVANAVGRFDKDDLAQAFGRLGPLTRRFPREPTVRFHLGLLLLWTGEIERGKAQLRRARATSPRSPLGREADAVLRRLAGVRNG